MVHKALPYFNSTYSGQGLEGFFSYVNTSLTNGLFIPVFLLVFYGLSIYVLTKNEWKLGGSIAFSSFVFFLLAMFAQTFTTFNQLVIFIFIIGIVIGIVMSFIENARN